MGPMVSACLQVIWNSTMKMQLSELLEDQHSASDAGTTFSAWQYPAVQVSTSTCSEVPVLQCTVRTEG